MTIVRDNWLQRCCAGLLGATWGVLVIGWAPLNPTYIGWLRVGDLSSAYTNLMYFRQSSWLQWPITALPDYGTGWSTMFNEVGVVPLGFVIKLLDPLLPHHFQYFGLWFLVCFILQAIVAHALLIRLRVHNLSLWAGVLLLVTAPVLSFRVAQLGHHDLAAHWIILLAVLMYLERDLRPVRLGLFLLLSLSINAYLFIIVLVVVTAHLFALATNTSTRVGPRRLMCALPIVYLPSVAAYAAFGYLSWGRSVVGVGSFKLNAVAFGASTYGGEEYAYLGVGVIVSVVAGVFTLTPTARRGFRQVFPLVIAAMVLFLVALSNDVAVGRWEFKYPLPEAFETLRQVVRVSNRLSWLLYYLLIIGGVVSVDRLLRQRRTLGLGLLAPVVLLQVSSVWPAATNQDTGVLRRPARVSVLQDERWNAWARSVEAVVIYPVFDVQAERDPETARSLVLAQTLDWFDIIWWAAENNLPINFAYRSRPVTEIVARENERLELEFATGSLNEQALYITASRDEWRPVVPRIPASMDTRFLDGLYVIYPSSVAPRP